MKKTLITIALFVLLTSLSVNAQSFGLSPKMYKMVEKNIVYTLNHQYASIAESAIFNLVVLKNRFPNENYDEFIDELDELSLDSDNSTTRYKAQLTSWYLKNANTFGLIEIADKNDDANKYFNKIADKIQSNLIALN